jgi:hypothetical protein
MKVSRGKLYVGLLLGMSRLSLSKAVFSVQHSALTLIGPTYVQRFP